MKTAIRIATYLRNSGTFVPVSQFTGRVPDPYYIEGAITLSVNGIELLTLEMWDLIDQLWAYFVSGLCNLREGKHFETTFPDQPLKVTFLLSKDRRMVTITVTARSTRQASCERDVFVKAMLVEAEAFFKRIASAVPDKSAYSTELEQIESLKRSQATQQGRTDTNYRSQATQQGRKATQQGRTVKQLSRVVP